MGKSNDTQMRYRGSRQQPSMPCSTRCLVMLLPTSNFVYASWRTNSYAPVTSPTLVQEREQEDQDLRRYDRSVRCGDESSKVLGLSQLHRFSELSPTGFAYPPKLNRLPPLTLVEERLSSCRYNAYVSRRETMGYSVR